MSLRILLKNGTFKNQRIQEQKSIEFCKKLGQKLTDKINDTIYRQNRFFRIPNNSWINSVYNAGDISEFCKILEKIETYQYYMFIGPELRRFLTNDAELTVQYTNGHKIDAPERLGYNFVEISNTDTSKLAYIPFNRLQHFYVADKKGKTVFDPWNEQLRKKYAVQTKPRKLLQRYITNKNTVEKISQLLTIDQLPTRIEILEGDDINDIFDKNKIYTDTGCLSSCMVTYHDLDKFEIYRDNCKAIVVRDTANKIHARAIFWQNVETDDIENYNGMFCDRVYFRKYPDAEKIHEYCRQNKILINIEKCTRVKSHWQYGDIIINSTPDLSFECCQDVEDYAKLPYMDTLQYTSCGDSTITNRYGDIELTDQEAGTPFESNAPCSCGCGLVVDTSDYSDNMIYIDDNYYHVDCDNIFKCDNCGDYHTAEDRVEAWNGEQICDHCKESGMYHYSEHDETWVHDNDVIWAYVDSDLEDQQAFSPDEEKNIIEVWENGRSYPVHDDYVYTVKDFEGDYIVLEKAKKCEYCNKYVHENETEYNDDHDILCNDCYNELEDEMES